MTPFWYGWPKWTSWIVEFGSGIVITAAVTLLSSWAPWTLWLVIGQFLCAQSVSWYYERYRDPTGWSWSDVGQRSIGILAGLFLWHVIW